MTKFQVGDIVIANNQCGRSMNIGAIGKIVRVGEYIRVLITSHQDITKVGRFMQFNTLKLDLYVPTNRSGLSLLKKR